jgi:hypothetical protein
MILNNGWLTDNIKEAVSKRSGVEKFVIKPIEKVYAHSSIDTDVHIERI